MKKLFCGVVVAMIGSVFSGCNTAPPVGIARYDLPINVVAILDTGEVLGAGGNNGCRLTTAEITQIVNDFIAKAPSSFGPETNVVWDGVVWTITGNHNNNRDVFHDVIVGAIAANQTLPWTYKPGYVNIYFAGNADPRSSIEGVAHIDAFGYNWDPLDAMHLTDINVRNFSMVVMNDADFGGAHAAANYLPLISRSVLSHEMGHHLGRFDVDVLNQSPFAGANADPNSPVYGPTADPTLAGMLRTYGGDEHNETFVQLMNSGLVPNLNSSIYLPGRTYDDVQGMTNAQAGMWGYRDRFEWGGEKLDVSNRLRLNRHQVP